jgi:predicted DNA-binding transcriptional regulator AlpA
MIERRRRPKPANCGVLSVQEVADMLYMSRSSVYKDIEETHVIPGCVKIGKRVFFSRAKVVRWLADPEGNHGGQGHAKE